MEDAQSLRVRLAKLGENIDATSKKILVLGAQKDTESHPQEQRLYQMVRTSAMIFIKEELLTLQPLPSVEEYTALQDERQKRIEARIAYEQQQLEEEQREKLKEQRIKKDTWNSDSSPFVKPSQEVMLIKRNEIKISNRSCIFIVYISNILGTSGSDSVSRLGSIQCYTYNVFVYGSNNRTNEQSSCIH